MLRVSRLGLHHASALVMLQVVSLLPVKDMFVLIGLRDNARILGQCEGGGCISCDAD